MKRQHNCDVLVIGSGAAGLSLALHLAQNADVVILSKGLVNDGSTFYAQGGVAAVFDENDTIASHVSDTLIAGAGICDEDIVQYTAQNAKLCLEWLINQGVDFDQEENGDGDTKYHLTREGGHSHRRILHAADATGQAIQTTLVDRVKQHNRIRIFERYNAVDLICQGERGSKERRCIGAYVWNRNTEKVERVQAKKLYWRQVGQAKYTNIHLTLMSPAETALQWRGVLVAVLPIWNLTSFIQPVYFTPMPVLFYLPKHYVVKGLF